ncbi:universal stress protein [Vannielia litorea]|uniref:Nucleotide-binding universal stress protein, UspA family n=1 Tax=Vannielia litorea TaxID=1217970 RepID=A0A1N6DXX4_9RHOB|nr:universal stress protein [Vannielia litorea]SIN75601.1 Nucleotide-binding universal stress protein, UspA family [Vannielia litorea]
MYSTILVPIAFEHDRDSNAALEIAEALLAPGGSITALHVIEEVPSYAATYVDEALLKEARTGVEEALFAKLGDHKTVTPRVVTGHSGRTILDVAESMGADLIVIASHRPGLQDYFLGSTAARVVRHAQCCVHVIR